MVNVRLIYLIFLLPLVSACSFQGPLHEQTASLNTSSNGCGGSEERVTQARKLSNAEASSESVSALCYKAMAPHVRKPTPKKNNYLARLQQHVKKLHRSNVQKAAKVVYYGGWTKQPN